MKNKPNLSLLDQTLFGLDTLTMLGDVEDFIQFSERNIDWQKQVEFRRMEHECNVTEFKDSRLKAQFQDQMLDSVKFRFEISLTQRIRYASLTTLITTIEWTLLTLKNRASFKIIKTPPTKNETIHILTVFNEKGALNLEQEIFFIETLINVRNCIVHAAGLLASYKYENELLKQLANLTGIKVSNINFLGDGIEIENGFLQDVIKNVQYWLPNVEKALLEQGLITLRAENNKDIT